MFLTMLVELFLLVGYKLSYILLFFRNGFDIWYVRIVGATIKFILF